MTHPLQYLARALAAALALGFHTFTLAQDEGALAGLEQPGEAQSAPDPAAAPAPAPDPAPADSGEAPAPAPAETQGAETIPVQPVSPEAGENLQVKEQGGTDRLDAVEVTGSRIRRTDYETAQPVTVVNRADIERTGLTNLGDILQRIPAAGSALNRNFNNGGNGQTEIDLRNLGSQRVLVLVNGHRWVSGTSFGDSAVDLNTIPVSVIERVEVLRDGASAIYGSDAITGVVNIITRKDFSGVEIGSQVQAFDDGKGRIHSHHISFGTIGEKSSIFFDVNFVRQQELFAGDRKQSSVPQFGTSLILSGDNFENELVHTRGSAVNPEGYFLFVPSAPALAALGPDKCPVLAGAGSTGAGAAPVPLPIPGAVLDIADMEGVRLCQVSPIRGEVVGGFGSNLALEADKFRKNGSIFGAPDPYQYNFAPINYLLTPYQQNSLFTQIGHQLLDNLSFSGQVLYTQTRADQAVAEEPLRVGDLFTPPQSQAYIAADQIYNPFGQDIGRADPAGELIGLGGVVRRMIETGPRFLGRRNSTLFYKAQLDGSFDTEDLFKRLGLQGFGQLFTYDVGYSNGSNSQVGTIKGAFNMERVAAALGPSMNCPSLNNPNCVPLNLFAPVGGITREMLDYVTYEAQSTARSSVEDVYFNMSTEFGGLAGRFGENWLASPIGFAFGLEYRREAFASQPDPFEVIGISSNLNKKPTVGDYHVGEAYAEVGLPLAEGLPLLQRLQVNIAARYTEYNTFDPKTTGKFGIEWKPVEDLLIRGTASTAFRAPNLMELFLGATESFPALDDPCAATDAAGNATARPSGTDVDNNCDAEGVPETPATQAQSRNALQGNPNLDAETAETFTAGFVYSPSFIPDFNIYADYFSIQMEDFIDFVDADYILQSCYERPAGVSRPATCDLVERNDTGLITTISSSPLNFATFETHGVDLAFDYVLPVAQLLPAMENWGSFKLMFDSQYLIDFNRTLPNPDGSGEKEILAGRDDTDGDQPYSRFKANATLQWQMADLRVSWSTRFIRGVTEKCNDGGNPSLASLGLCSDPDFDLSDGLDDSENTYPDVFYHNVQGSYVLPNLGTELTLGINNVLDQDPPVSASAFANSYPATLYEPWGSRQPYARIKINF